MLSQSIYTLWDSQEHPSQRVLQRPPQFPNLIQTLSANMHGSIPAEILFPSKIMA